MKTEAQINSMTVLGRWRSWLYLGMIDVNRQYRRSVLGIVWVVLQPIAWLLLIWTVFNPVFATTFPNYLSYVAVAVILYNAAAHAIGSASDTFLRYRNILLNIPIAPLNLILRAVVSSLYIFTIQLPVAISVIVLQNSFDPSGLIWAAVSLVLFIIFIISVSVIFAVLGALSGDFRFLIQTSMRFLFFATPIFWLIPTEESLRKLLAVGNPLTHYMSLMRQTVEGYVPEFNSFTICVVCSAGTALVAVAIWSWARKSMSRAL